ncbi:hypothetical protein KBY47_05525 [Streptomyces sp. B93]|nr:hypothetical protein [Streptomyces sp. B93]
MHRDLPDVEAAVDAVGDWVVDRGGGVVGHEPGQPRGVVADEFTGRKRLVLGDLRHADASEALPGVPLDVLEGGQSVQAHGSDVNAGLLHGTPTARTDRVDVDVLLIRPDGRVVRALPTGQDLDATTLVRVLGTWCGQPA